MNIGIFMYDYLPKIGGAQICAHCMANCFVEAGHGVFVYGNHKLISASKRRGWTFKYSARGVNRYLSYALRKNSYVGRKLLTYEMIKAIKRDKLDIMQIVCSWPWIAATNEVKSATNIPIIVRCAGDDIQVDHAVGYGLQRNDKFRQIQGRGFQSIDVGIAISETVRSEYLSAGIPDGKIMIIPPGVDANAFYSCNIDRIAVRMKWGLPVNKKLIIGVGRNHPKKCFNDLIRALAILNKNNNQYIVAVIGKESDRLADEARSLGVGSHYFPIKEVSSMPEEGCRTFPSRELIELYKVADYFVHPSAIETYANVALEAMAAGTPVIVTNAPGNIDTVDDGIDGLIVPMNAPTQIAEIILNLDNNECLRNSIVTNALRKARSQDWMTIARSYLGVYNDLLN